jgi:hypothetical protein
VLGLLALAVSAWYVAAPAAWSSVAVWASPAAVRKPAACVAPLAGTQRDIDDEDSPEHPWAHTPGQPIVVYFQTGGLPDRYASLVRRAAAIWSRSACVSAVAVDRCPDGARCSTVRTKERSRDTDTDGESVGDDHHGVRRGNAITYYTGELDRSSGNGALATVVHEMGHALGLVHRNDASDVMNADTDNGTDPVPDSTDFRNLAVLYG